VRRYTIDDDQQERRERQRDYHDDLIDLIEFSDCHNLIGRWFWRLWWRSAYRDAPALWG
jgi:hypothetical protein